MIHTCIVKNHSIVKTENGIDAYVYPEDQIDMGYLIDQEILAEIKEVAGKMMVMDYEPMSYFEEK